MIVIFYDLDPFFGAGARIVNLGLRAHLTAIIRGDLAMREPLRSVGIVDQDGTDAMVR